MRRGLVHAEHQVIDLPVDGLHYRGLGCGSRGVRFATDSLLEGTGFEPSVPLLQKALLGVANRDVGTISGTKGQVRDREDRLGGPPMAVPFAAGPMVRIRFPPALSPLRTSFSGGKRSKVRGDDKGKAVISSMSRSLRRQPRCAARAQG